MFVREAQHHRFGRQFMRFDGVLRNDAILVLNFHWHVVIGKERTSFLKDPGHLSCFDAMLVILTDPYLQQAVLSLAKFAAAVDKCLLHETDLSDVKRNWHR
ncbi:MAG: hypothetical protein RLZ22_874 [Verrucomicrobiota bacterium]